MSEFGPKQTKPTIGEIDANSQERTALGQIIDGPSIAHSGSVMLAA